LTVASWNRKGRKKRLPSRQGNKAGNRVKTTLGDLYKIKYLETKNNNKNKPTTN